MNSMLNASSEEIKYTYCSICEQTCGLKVTVDGNDILDIEPDKENPYSWRDFCIKGKMADEVRSHPVRIRAPMRRIGSRYVESTYDEALGDIGGKLRQLIAEFGPDSIGIYSGNPAGFGFANSAFQGAFFDAIGSKQRYWVGSIDQNALHYVGEQMYGSNWASLQLDVDHCRCFLFIGTNPAISGLNWVGKVPDGWRRVLRAVDQGADLIIVDPRRTESAQKATCHIAPLPEQDWALLLAILRIIFDQNWDDTGACEDASGVDDLKALAQSADLGHLAKICDVDLGTIEDVARKFASAPTAMCVARTGPALGRQGAVTEWLSHVLNLVTGRIDKRGGRFLPGSLVDLFTLDEGPNAPNCQPSRVRGLRPVAGSYSLAELPGEICVPGEGQIRALFINGGNPVVSGPLGRRLDEALQSLELLVAIDLMQRESHQHAHWIIPGIHFLERNELHVSSCGVCDEPFVQASTACVEPPDGVRHEWEFFRDLANEVGTPLFGGAIEAHPDNIAEGILARKSKFTLAEIRQHPHGLKYGDKTYGHLKKALEARGRKIQACPDDLKKQLEKLLVDAQSCQAVDGSKFKMIGRRRLQMMNSWLTETCGAKIRREIGDEIELNARDAERESLKDGDRVLVRSDVGSLEAVVTTSQDVRPGVVVMDHGWGSRLFDPETKEVHGDTRGVIRNQLVSGDDLDPLTGVPRLNGTPVSIERLS